MEFKRGQAEEGRRSASVRSLLECGVEARDFGRPTPAPPESKANQDGAIDLLHTILSQASSIRGELLPNHLLNIETVNYGGYNDD